MKMRFSLYSIANFFSHLNSKIQKNVILFCFKERKTKVEKIARKIWNLMGMKKTNNSTMNFQ